MTKSGNKIKEILYPLFALPSLTYLLLRSNQIEVFDDKKIESLLMLQSSSLHELSLANNKIDELPDFFSTLRIDNLDMRFNNISHISSSFK